LDRPIRGNRKTETAFRINTIPSDVAITAPEALRTGDNAEIALPPHIEVPAQMSSERGDATLKERARIRPTIKTILILTKVIAIPSIPFFKTL
jgi:hypothetical protein